MIGPPTGDLHPIYNAPMLGAHKMYTLLQGGDTNLYSINLANGEMTLEFDLGVQ